MDNDINWSQSWFFVLNKQREQRSVCVKLHIHTLMDVRTCTCTHMQNLRGLLPSQCPVTPTHVNSTLIIKRFSQSSDEPSSVSRMDPSGCGGLMKHFHESAHSASTPTMCLLLVSITEFGAVMGRGGQLRAKAAPPSRGAWWR